MKLSVAVALFFVFFQIQTIHAQKAMSFEEATAEGLDFQKLDSLYQPGVGEEGTAVFTEQEDDYIKSYYALLNDLRDFLASRDFVWGGVVRCSNRIYFAANGGVDYYFFDFITELPSSKQQEFKELLGLFIMDYNFGLSAAKPFSLHSPVNYRDPL